MLMLKVVKAMLINSEALLRAVTRLDQTLKPCPSSVPVKPNVREPGLNQSEACLMHHEAAEADHTLQQFAPAVGHVTES